MSKILYNTEFLRSKAAQMRQAGNEHTDAIDKIVNLVKALPDIWEGEAERNFIAGFDALTSMFEGFEQNIEAFAEMLEASAKNMEDADNTMQKKINSAG